MFRTNHSTETPNRNCEVFTEFPFIVTCSSVYIIEFLVHAEQPYINYIYVYIDYVPTYYNILYVYYRGCEFEYRDDGRGKAQAIVTFVMCSKVA